jgi:hypothetical protein
LVHNVAEYRNVNDPKNKLRKSFEEFSGGRPNN